jgi:ubiquinone/menaquinone biosynthesis C-methylase UbiE
MPKHAALYEELAPYYDMIYNWKDYQKEASKLIRLVRSNQLSTGRDLLDVACGTGRHLSYLRRRFNCAGIDDSVEMLAVAKKKVRGVRFIKGSMTNFDARKKFDIVLCLFSSMGYLRTQNEIRRAAANFARHLKRGGVLIVEPWLRKSAWSDRTVHMQHSESDSLKIARVSFAWADGDLSVLDERYLIAQKGEGVKYVRDLHKMRFFEVESTLQAFRETGLEARFTEDSLMPGRGLLIATKQSR